MNTNGRDSRGRFTKGRHATGREPGVPNRASVDLRLIRNAIIGTWDEVDGCKKLIELATENFPLYCKLVLPLLPKDEPASVFPIAATPEHTPRTIGFFADLERMSGGAPVTPELLLDAYKRDFAAKHEEDDEQDENQN